MLQFIAGPLEEKPRHRQSVIFDYLISMDDKFFDEINTGMVKLFDLRTRFKEVQSNFKTSR
jgi:hypothetical protein